MKSYLDDSQLKQDLLAEVERHAAAYAARKNKFVMANKLIELLAE